MPVFLGKTLFLGTNQVLCPGSVHGLVIIAGLTQLRITWRESLNELPRAGRSEGTSVGDRLVNGGGRTILNVGSTISRLISRSLNCIREGKATWRANRKHGCFCFSLLLTVLVV